MVPDAPDEPAGGVLPADGPGDGEATALAEPFNGITIDGRPREDLFPRAATGVPTEPIRAAADAFLAALTVEQRTTVMFPVDDGEWRKWSDADDYRRQGISLDAMTPEQRSAAMQLLAVTLSAQGLETVQNIMKLNRTLGELTSELSRFNETLYWFTVMGVPSATEPWGFQVDGHHLVINCFILGDQLVLSPVLLGAEPPIAPRGTFAGLRVLQREHDQGLALIRRLTPEQLSLAIISARKRAADMQAGAFRDNAILPYTGIRFDALTGPQQVRLVDLLDTWIGYLPDAHAAVKRMEVRRHLDETFFAWIGDTGDDAVFYYRIHSPVIFIEFDYQAPGPLGDNPYYFTFAPTRDHVHAVLRTPNGNDYGNALHPPSVAGRNATNPRR